MSNISWLNCPNSKSVQPYGTPTAARVSEVLAEWPIGFVYRHLFYPYTLYTYIYIYYYY